MTKISAYVHTGTHLDAPSHFIREGENIGDIAIDRLIGTTLVWDVHARGGTAITRAQLEDAGPPPRPGEAVFISTGWSSLYYDQEAYLNHPYLDTDAAVWLRGKGVRLVGMDFLTPDAPTHLRDQDFDFPVHHTLLGHGVLILENLGDMSEVVGKRVWTVVAPIKIDESDGAPARVLARLEG